MDIKAEAMLRFTMTVEEDEMDIISTLLGAAMIYREDAMDGAAEDALISVMQSLPEGKLFPLGNKLQMAFAQACEGKFDIEEPT